jgi:hypothetical protein
MRAGDTVSWTFMIVGAVLTGIGLAEEALHDVAQGTELIQLAAVLCGL